MSLVPSTEARPDPIGKISEIFRSIQGEGIYAGMIEQVFVRFSGCNLKCEFCDTQDVIKNYREYKPESVLEKVLRLSKSNPGHASKNGIHSVSITGGEPLLQIDFLQNLCNSLLRNNIKIYLETNGVIYNNLKYIIKFIDIISMDFKLPSSTGLTSFWKEHLEFLKIASKKDCFVKIVITKDTGLADIRKGIEVIAKVNKNIPLILQPVTFTRTVPGTQPGYPRKWVGVGGQSPSTSQILKFLKISKEYLNDVRVIPQIHKLLGVK